MPDRAQVLHPNNIPCAPLRCLSCSCKIENAFKLREIQQETTTVWTLLQQKYGGGTVLQQKYGGGGTPLQ